MTDIKKFHFWVGDEDQRKSSTWTVSNEDNDVYIYTVEYGGCTKFSLHESGYCHYAITREYYEKKLVNTPMSFGKRPIFNNWHRSICGHGEVSVPLIIRLPFSFMSDPKPTINSKTNRACFILDPINTIGALDIIFIYSNASDNRDFKPDETVTPLVYTELPNGERLSVVAKMNYSVKDSDILDFIDIDAGKWKTNISDPISINETRDMQIFAGGQKKEGETNLFCELNLHKFLSMKRLIT